MEKCLENPSYFAFGCGFLYCRGF